MTIDLGQCDHVDETGTRCTRPAMAVVKSSDGEVRFCRDHAPTVITTSPGERVTVSYAYDGVTLGRVAELRPDSAIDRPLVESAARNAVYADMRELCERFAMLPPLEGEVGALQREAAALWHRSNKAGH